MKNTFLFFLNRTLAINRFFPKIIFLKGYKNRKRKEKKEKKKEKEKEKEK